jgi:hypothetical protein
MSNKSQNETEILTTAEFFEQLKQDKLATPMPESFGVIGMVKKSEGQDETIEFAAGMKCSGWVTTPIELIENVEMIQTVPCGDHSHPLVKLNLKTPKTPEGKLLFAILDGMKSPYEAMQRGIEANANGSGVSLGSRVSDRVGNGFWGCSDTYCGCDNPLDCFLMGASGNCSGRRVICGRNGCVCIPIRL